jgi:hypothetical protein
VTGGYYATLGLQPAAGRLLTESDDRPGAIPVAAITDDYWRRKFGRNPLAIGQQILVEGKTVTIVGVSPAGFTGANVGEAADFTLPLGVLPQIQLDRNYTLDTAAWWLRVLARPQPGVSHTQVKAGLTVVWRPLGESVNPANSGSRYRVEQSTLDAITGGTGYSDLRRQFRRPLLVLMAVDVAGAARPNEVLGLAMLFTAVNVSQFDIAATSTKNADSCARRRASVRPIPQASVRRLSGLLCRHSRYVESWHIRIKRVDLASFRAEITGAVSPATRTCKVTCEPRFYLNGMHPIAPLAVLN